MNIIQRLHCDYAAASFAPRAPYEAAPRRPELLRTFALALTFVVADAYAAVVNFQDVVQQGIDVTAGLTGAAALAADPGGGRLYVAATADSSLSTFDRDAGGALSALEVLLDDGVGGVTDGLSVAADVAVSPDGTHVFAVALNDHALSVFARTAQGLAHVATYRDGTSGIAGLRFPNRVAVSPDGAHVYVATRNTSSADSVFTFEVTGADGRLALLARYQEGVDSVSGIGDATGLAVSPDGRHVYVSGGFDNSIAAFARDDAAASAGFGALDWIASYRDGIDGVDGIGGAGDLALDPAGTHLYVAGTDEDSVAAFSRDDASGTLTPLVVYRNGADGITGLNGPLALVVSPDGGHVYAAGAAEHALVVLRRDPLSGLLTHLETHRNDDGGIVDGLDRVLALATSPDGAQLYSASPLAAEIGIFTLASADLALTMTAEAATAVGAAYRLTVANNGPDDASDIRLTDLLPAGAIIVDLHVPAGATCTQAGDRIVCGLGALAAGDTIELILQFDLAGAGGNAAAVYADQRDPDASNNAAGEAAQTNLPPVAVDDGARTAPGASVGIEVLANDSDPDGDALSVSAHDAASLHGGTIALNPDGTLSYTPSAGFRGTDTFGYTISDRLAEASAGVTVTVNTPPLARDDAATAAANTTIQILVLSNDSDADSDALLVAGADALSLAGGAVVNNGASVSYTPPAGFSGGDSFTYNVSDGQDTAVATVAITVQPVGSGVSVDPPGDNEVQGRRGGGGGLDVLCGLALLLRALGRRLRPAIGPARS
jgi:6-phosphogluconolactonase (cycloisomerase 2 family)